MSLKDVIDIEIQAMTDNGVPLSKAKGLIYKSLESMQETLSDPKYNIVRLIKGLKQNHIK